MDLKSRAAERAIESIGDAKILGLGTGSTAEIFLDQLALSISSGKYAGIVGIPTSARTEKYARNLSIPLANLDDVLRIDITFDGADEVDPQLNLIKGHGGALTREKIVASASEQLTILVDDSKRVDLLGSKFSVPVEVLRFGWTQVRNRITELGANIVLRTDGTEPYVTDEGNYILDCMFQPGISDTEVLNTQLKNLTGVVEHGIFLGMATKVIVASDDGVEVLEK
jgi:ribose 5-phosphate isomerase A